MAEAGLVVELEGEWRVQELMKRRVFQDLVGHLARPPAFLFGFLIIGIISIFSEDAPAKPEVNQSLTTNPANLEEKFILEILPQIQLKMQECSHG